MCPSDALKILQELIQLTKYFSILTICPMGTGLLHETNNCMYEVKQLASNSYENAQVMKHHTVGISHADSKSKTSTEHILARVMDIAGEVVEKSLDAQDPLLHVGLDSLGAVELRTKLNDTFSLHLPSTIVFDQPTPLALAETIRNELTSGDPPTITETSHTRHNPDHTPYVNIVSVGVKENTMGAKDDIISVPESRWDIGTDEHSLIRFGKFLKNITHFDVDLFSMRLMETIGIDPQQRILLECALHVRACLPNAHFNKECGVIVGISSTDYSTVTASEGKLQATGGSLSVACGRISFTFNLRGICTSIDTACSSSLVGSHVSCRAVRDREYEILSCGINLTLSPMTTHVFRSAGMLADDGRCKTLDISANGYVRSEGSVVLLLTNGGSQIKAVPCSFQISASAVNQDGRSSTLTAPHGPSQQSVILKTMLQPGNDHCQLSSFELHGTGTALGDPIEIGAAHAVLHQLSTVSTMYFSAMKSHHGHAEPASGLMGLRRLLVSIPHLQVPTIMHLSQLSAYIQNILNQMPIACTNIVTARQHMQNSYNWRPQTTNNGVSAFAFQGTNAHVSLRQNHTHGHGTLSTKDIMKHQRKCWIVKQVHRTMVISTYERRDTLVIRHQLDQRWSTDRDHCIRTRLVIPAARFIELIVASVKGFQLPAHPTLHSMQIHTPFLIDTSNNRALHCTVHQRFGTITLSSVNTTHTSCMVMHAQTYPSHLCFTQASELSLKSTTFAAINLHFKVPNRKMSHPSNAAKLDAHIQSLSALRTWNAVQFENDLHLPSSFGLYIHTTLPSNVHVYAASRCNIHKAASDHLVHIGARTRTSLLDLIAKRLIHMQRSPTQQDKLQRREETTPNISPQMIHRVIWKVAEYGSSCRLQDGNHVMNMRVHASMENKTPSRLASLLLQNIHVGPHLHMITKLNFDIISAAPRSCSDIQSAVGPDIPFTGSIWGMLKSATHEFQKQNHITCTDFDASGAFSAKVTDSLRVACHKNKMKTKSMSHRQTRVPVMSHFRHKTLKTLYVRDNPQQAIVRSESVFTGRGDLDTQPVMSCADVYTGVPVD